MPTDRQTPPAPTTIRAARALRDQWPDPLAREWLAKYPQLFDDDDLRLTVTQPIHHFCEWYAATHLFERDGVRVLVEKYLSPSHAAKRAKLAAVLSDGERETLAEILAMHHTQPPDLFVFHPGTHDFWFVEVKGPGDRLSAKQRESHGAIVHRLGVPVEVVKVVVSD